MPQIGTGALFGVYDRPGCPIFPDGGTTARPSGQEVEGPLVVAAAALSTSVVVGELSAQEMGCHGACLLAIILAS